MPVLPDGLAAREQLHAVNVDRVHAGAVVGQDGRQRPPDHLGPVDDGDGPAVQPVAVREGEVVDLEVFKTFDYGQGRAWLCFHSIRHMDA